MNTELLIRVAEAIESQPERFDLSNWFNGPRIADESHEALVECKAASFLAGDCGSTACIAGWATALMAQTLNFSVLPLEWAMFPAHAAAKWLDLTKEQASRLFFSEPLHDIETGEIKHTIWSELESEYSYDCEDSTTITAYEAADVLKRIAKGDVKL